MTKSIILAAIFVLALAVALACTPPEPVVERVEVTREVEVPVAVPQTVEVKVPFPQTRIVEQTVEVTREVPITVVVTATPPPATPTPIPTPTSIPTPTRVPTPTPDLANAELANLWLAIYPIDWCDPCIGVSADPAFDVIDFAELNVIVRAGTRSETFFNTDRIYGDDGYLLLSQTLDGRISSVTGVSAESGLFGSLRCAKHRDSTAAELTFACAWR